MKKAILSGVIAGFLIILAMLVAGCNTEKLSFDSVESGRKQANENSQINANAFRQAHPEYAGWGIQTRGDSTQSAECGQGDGWATIDLVKIDGETKKVESLKCSTVSEAIGCRTAGDFKTSPYASQDGVCNSEIPFPLPKIQH